MDVRSFLRGIQAAVATSPIPGAVAMTLNHRFMSSGGSDCIHLFLGMALLMWVICTVFAASTLCGVIDKLVVKNRVVRFADEHRILTAILGEFVCGTVVVGIVFILKGVKG